MSGPLKKIPGKQIKPQFTETVTAPQIEAEVKYFRVKHPIEENKTLVHSCLEGPEHGIYVRGKNNSYIIKMPDYFRNFIDYKSITVHLTSLGTYTPLYVKSIDVGNNTINIGVALKDSKRELEYSYIIYADRIDLPKLQITQDNIIAKIKKVSFLERFKNLFKMKLLKFYNY